MSPETGMGVFALIVFFGSIVYCVFSLIVKHHAEKAHKEGYREGAIDHALKKVKVTADPRRKGDFHVVIQQPNKHASRVDQWANQVAGMDSL